MLSRRQNRLGFCGTALLLIAVATAVLAVSTNPAAAQGIFETLFGRRFGPPAHRGPPPGVSAYADPFSYFFGSRSPETPRSEMGGGTAFCVRTCDGRYFPMQRNAGANPAQTCSAFCPASQTKIYNGGSIDSAVGPDGKRYSELGTAFVYRDKIVPGCTCNGKDAFGLVNTTVADDPTLRPGDIVVTNTGMMAYTGVGKRQNAQFTPIDRIGMAPDLRRKLSETKIAPAAEAPAPVPAAQQPTAADGPPPVRNGRNQRVQISR